MSDNRSQINPIEITACEREPIHIPGSIQPHGLLLALHGSELAVLQASTNVPRLLGRREESVLGKSLEDLFGTDAARALRTALANPSLERNPLFLGTVPGGSNEGRHRSLHAVAHRIDGVVILELETAASAAPVSFQNLYPLVRNFLHGLAQEPSIQGLSQLAAAEVRRITGFNRVLVYQFDENWNGRVIAEDRDEELPSYLDLHFPASDIPQPIHELYRLNRLRLIPDCDYRPVPILPALNPLTNQPLDLSYALLRSVAPVHCEYLRNMGTRASLSISVLRGGRLWGLIACHHRRPRTVPFEARTACDFLAQVLSLQIAAREGSLETGYRMKLKSVLLRLLAAMAREDGFLTGLTRSPDDLLELTAAQGAAVQFGGECILLGRTPPLEQVRRLTEWLADRMQEDWFASDSLASLLPEAAAYREVASGLLALAVSKRQQVYVLWFRPEILQTVRWGGDPHQPAEPAADGLRLHPRKSFALWEETVRLKSLPWREAEIQAALDLRQALVNLILHKAEELAQLSAELARSNRELEAFSYSVSHDLRAPLRHILSFAELLQEVEAGHLSDRGRRYLDTILAAARYAGTLVDSLLNLSRVARTALTPIAVDMNHLVEEVRQEVLAEAAGRKIVWKIHPLPVVQGDVMLLRLAVRNLLANAIKYTRPRSEAVIEVGCEPHDREYRFFVRDNGVGFDMEYADKLFGVFQRLHRMEEFEGTGVGLAGVRRIIERHGGRTWAEGAVGQGATFWFSLPQREE